jgi:VWFA-related protein
MRCRLAVLPCALLATLAPAQERGQVPTFPSQVDLVTVDAVVLDAKGDLVRGLTADDFVLFEDGRPQAIASFEAFEAPASVAASPPEAASTVATNRRAPEHAGRPFVLLVDDMSLAPSRGEEVRKAIAHFIADGVRDGDELIFATTSGDAWWSARIPEGREDVLALVARVRGRRPSEAAPDAISDWEAFRISNIEGITAGAAGSAAGAGPPGGPGGASNQGPPPGALATEIGGPGSNITERVRQRYLQRGACDPRETPAFCYAKVRGRAQQVDVRRRARTRDTLAVVDRAVFALTGVRGRKSLLLLTEGFLSDPGLGAVQEVASRCREANIAVYSLDVRGLVAGLEGTLAADAGRPNTGEMTLMRAEQVEFSAAGSVGLAEDTGGFAVRDTNDLAGGAVRAAMESRVHYLLGYAPPADKSPLDWRKLKVEIKRPGLRVRARKGYTLRTAAEIAAAAEARLAVAAGRTPPLPPDVARAMANAHPADAIPLRATAYVFEERPGGTIRTIVAVEVDTRSLANLGGDEHARAAVSLSIAATHRDSGKTLHAAEMVKVEGGAAGAWEGWLVLARPFDLPPGVSQARVVVRDEFLGRLGALTLRFVVPPLGGLRVSTPVITDRLVPASEGGPARPALVARREFDGARSLFCQFEVFGSSRAGLVDAWVELRRREGEVVRRSTSSPITVAPDGRLVRLVALPLGLAEGEYELVVRVEERATGATREHVEPLKLTAPGS